MSDVKFDAKHSIIARIATMVDRNRYSFLTISSEWRPAKKHKNHFDDFFLVGWVCGWMDFLGGIMSLNLADFELWEAQPNSYFKELLLTLFYRQLLYIYDVLKACLSL